MNKTAAELVEILRNKKGQNVRAVWQRQAETLKSAGPDILIEKRTAAVVRSGINYANLADIREAIEAGTRGEVEGLPWGQWREGYANYIIDHKEKEYLRLYPSSHEGQRPSVQWFLNGAEVEAATVEPYLTAKEKRHERGACFTLKPETILELAGE